MSQANESTQNDLVRCDLDYPPLIDELNKMEDPVIDAVLNSAIKIQKMTWAQVFSSGSGEDKRGINYEVIEGQKTKEGVPIHSIRINEKIRARVVRDGVVMRFISVHPDHDSAYSGNGGEDV